MFVTMRRSRSIGRYCKTCTDKRDCDILSTFPHHDVLSLRKSFRVALSANQQMNHSGCSVAFSHHRGCAMIVIGFLSLQRGAACAMNVVLK
jgi:hypothetical protein